MDEMGVPGDRMFVFNVRGCENPLLTEAGRFDLAQKIKEQRGAVLIVDPFGRAFAGEQNDASQVAPWLVNLDQVAEMSGCSEMLLTAHAGWNGERARGSSALEDWPDAIVTMRKDSEKNRWLKADGRDVDIEEMMLIWNETTRTYSPSSATPVSARERAITMLADEIVKHVKAVPGMNMTELTASLKNDGVTYQKGNLAPAREQAEMRKQIRTEPKGKGLALFPVDLYVVAPPAASDG
jgi:RecA-family ATPase